MGGKPLVWFRNTSQECPSCRRPPIMRMTKWARGQRIDIRGKSSGASQKEESIQTLSISSLHMPSCPRPRPTQSWQCRESMWQNLLVPRPLLLATLSLVGDLASNFTSYLNKQNWTGIGKGLHRGLIGKSGTEFVAYPKD